ncbi:hypothetical protein [Sphingopyxis sp. USTB-05]|uniref:hypothetical protein n=1 Tax=Sphingopyxis sp. USTB-05 TaxID=2830667 RepID=UPI002078AFB6|nr:hypothetical protein [Sphingopyxis sp. USTB-05]USI78703.1 hypothetical protein KEC45_07365 [Sphingopyxis sp. USTB-05]
MAFVDDDHVGRIFGRNAFLAISVANEVDYLKVVALDDIERRTAPASRGSVGELDTMPVPAQDEIGFRAEDQLRGYDIVGVELAVNAIADGVEKSL